MEYRTIDSTAPHFFKVHDSESAAGRFHEHGSFIYADVASVNFQLQNRKNGGKPEDWKNIEPIPCDCQNCAALRQPV